MMCWTATGSTARGASSACSAPCANVAGNSVEPAASKPKRIVRYTAVGRFHMISLRGLTVLVS